MSDSASKSNVLTSNPYESHLDVSTIEAEVLWEYAKLAQHIKELTVKTQELSELPENKLVPQLRSLERKMGLVLTLFKASVWGVINEKQGMDLSEHQR